VPESDPQAERELDPRAMQRADELAALSTHLLQSVESERSELAKQLHDELGGLITAAKMDMAWLSARIGKSLDAESSEKFNSVVQMLNQAMILKRRVVESLRPSLLDHFGLSVAMRSHFEEQCRNAGIECVASLPEDSFELDAAAQLTLFRVAQEVLSGIIARGGVKNVEIVIEPEEGGYAMVIGDDGSAMDTNLARVMPSVRHRVALSGGHIEVEARDGAAGQAGGNRVRVYVPRSATRSA
jgi:glucose-6-phosphate-specific signal transduction histidine kinase